MWAQLMTAPFTFESIEIEALEETDLADGEVLLRFLAGGLCGSDGPFYRGAMNTPVYGGPLPGRPMHEVVGEILATRSPHHEVGDHVVGWATGFDGLKEKLITDGESLHRYDPSLTAAEAVMLQPLACVLHAVDNLGDVSGRRCAVIGQGPIGVLFSHVLKHRGASRVTGIDRLDRRTALPAFGVDDPVHLTSGYWAAGLTDEDRPEVVVEAVGHQVSTMTHAIDAVGVGGRVFYFGIPDDAVYPINMLQMLRKHLTLMSGTTVGHRRALSATDAYLQRYPELIRHYITQEYKVDEAAPAYAAAFTPSPEQFKIVVVADNA